MHRENYEQNTIESLSIIKSDCEKLGREVDLSRKFQASNDSHTLTAIRTEVQQIPHEVRNSFYRIVNDFEQTFFSELDRRTRIQQEAFDRKVLLQQQEYDRRFLSIIHATASLSSRPASPMSPPMSLPSPPQRLFQPGELLFHLGIADILTPDLHQLRDKREIAVSQADRSLAEHIVRTGPFQQWLGAPRSTQLLVHGNYERRASYISGLSLFCMSMWHMLTERRYVPLVFFSGLHFDSNVDSQTGGLAVIRSLIQQLLSQTASGEFGACEPIALTEEEFQGMQQGDLGMLCRLFMELVRRLPRTAPVFIVLDGVVFYEREEFWRDFQRVLVSILQLSSEWQTQAPVKVLVASPMPTARVREIFPNDLIMSMQGMASAGLVASTARLEREFGSLRDDSFAE